MLVFSICIFFIDTWEGLGFCFLVLITSAILLFFFDFERCRVQVKTLFKSTFLIASPIYVLCIFTILFNSLSLNSEALFSHEGFFRGLFFAVRMILLIWYSLLIANTISWASFADVLSWFFGPLRRLKVPVDDIATTASIALRFLPQSFREFQQLRDSAWTRGAKLDQGSIVVRTKSYCSCLIPLLVSMIRKSEELSLALCMRSYGLFEVKFNSFNKISILEFLIVLFLSICLIAVAVLL